MIREHLHSELGNEAVTSIERSGDIEPLPSCKLPVVKMN